MDHETSPQLTEHEIRVLRLVAQGLTNKEIAYALNIAERTVEFHVHQIFEKLNVASRTAASMVAHKLGLLDA
jgi:DNA-binding NarL/FixJ family response regulator